MATHKKLPEQTAHLGHMAGYVPPSVRFINLRGVLSSESIQALCILLKKSNFAFSHGWVDSDSSSPSINPIMNSPSSQVPISSIPSGRDDISRSPSSHNSSHHESSSRRSSFAEEEKCEPSMYHRTPLRPLKGLLGLAITHTAFTPLDIKYLLELLAVYPNKPIKPPRRQISDSSNGSVRSSRLARLDENGLMSTSPRGIRFLDLSKNHLADNTCADILNAACLGPLEGLDLGGNNIGKGKEFIETLSRTIAHPGSIIYIRQLGLSNNGLTNKAVCQILDCLQGSMMLTYLDLSHNEIQHSKQLEGSLRDFMKYNRSLRILDLSYNRLNQESVKCIYLGLLENETLLLLPLVYNNFLTRSASELPLIQSKLTDNRKRYKMSLDMYNEGINKENLKSSRNTPFSSKSGREIDSPRSNSNSKVEQLLNRSNEFTETDNQNRLGYATGTSSSATRPLFEDIDPLLSSSPLHRPVNIISSPSNSNTLSSNVPTQFAIAVPMSINDRSAQLPVAQISTPTISSPDSRSSSGIGETGRNLTVSSPKEQGMLQKSISTPAQALHVFFSAPLAWSDRQGRSHPLEMLNYDAERDSIIHVLKEVHRDISVCFQFATTNNLRTALSFGCRALHFSGHGHPEFVSL
jgi:hypothetical protein